MTLTFGVFVSKWHCELRITWGIYALNYNSVLTFHSREKCGGERRTDEVKCGLLWGLPHNKFSGLVRRNSILVWTSAYDLVMHTAPVVVFYLHDVMRIYLSSENFTFRGGAIFTPPPTIDGGSIMSSLFRFFVRPSVRACVRPVNTIFQ